MANSAGSIKDVLSCPWCIIEDSHLLPQARLPKQIIENECEIRKKYGVPSKILTMYYQAKASADDT